MKNSLDCAPQMRQISKDLRWYCPLILDRVSGGSTRWFDNSLVSQNGVTNRVHTTPLTGSKKKKPGRRC